MGKKRNFTKNLINYAWKPKKLNRDHIISKFKIHRTSYFTLCNMLLTDKLLRETAKKKGKLPKCKKCSLIERR